MNRIGIIVVISLLSAGWGLVLRPAPVKSATVESYETISSMGQGFVVWESNRSNAWRLWRIGLDGKDLKQISPDEPGRDHFCPHISPNGRQLVYLSYPRGEDTYHEHPEVSPATLHLMNADGTGDRILLPGARAYAEDRAVVWVDDDRFHYIDGQGLSWQYTISSKASVLLTKQTKQGYGWLVNVTRSFAVTGEPTFCPYNAGNQTISSAKALDGCQPYFSSDGKWGFWMGGAGGPINRYELSTGNVSPILSRNDPRMPKERNYLYFPMLSHNGRLLAFGASPNQHDHFRSDYDIFVVRTNPTTLEVVGSPVRYSFDPGCDRFPDVYVSDLDLGSYQGEAPYTVQFTAPAGTGSVLWAFGDGTKGAGATVKHTYTKPGEYAVEMKRTERIFHGVVAVKSASAPTVGSVTLRGDRHVSMSFNEPVDVIKAKFALNGRQMTKGITLASDGLSVELSSDKALTKGAVVRVEGLRDRAQVPNTMPAQQFNIQPHMWPIDPNSVVVQWDNTKSGCVAPNNVHYDTQAVGQAYPDHKYALQTSGGSYRVSGADETLLKGCQQTNKLTIEAEITTHIANQSGPARIITYSSGASSRNFTIGQEGNRLMLRLRTSQTDLNGVESQAVLADILPNRPMHLMLCYSPGSLQCYVDGKLHLDTPLIQGDFSNWSAQHLLIGNEWETQRPWMGTISGLVIYNQKYGATQAARSYESYRALHPTKSVIQVKLLAKLLSSSKLPTLAEIIPYREALVTSEYEVQSVSQGKCDAKKIVVVRWAIVGGEELGVSKPDNKGQQTLVLEPYADNPQLEGFYMSDTLNADPAIPMFYAPSL